MIYIIVGIFVIAHFTLPKNWEDTTVGYMYCAFCTVGWTYFARVYGFTFGYAVAMLYFTLLIMWAGRKKGKT